MWRDPEIPAVRTVIPTNESTTMPLRRYTLIHYIVLRVTDTIKKAHTVNYIVPPNDQEMTPDSKNTTLVRQAGMNNDEK